MQTAFPSSSRAAIAIAGASTRTVHPLPQIRQKDKSNDRIHAARKHQQPAEHAQASLENSGTLQQARQALSTLHPAEIASLLESTPSPERELIWGLVSPEDESEVLLQVNDEVRSRLIQDMDVEQLVAITEDMDLDDLADIIDDLPQAVTRQVIRSMDQQERARLESVLSYPRTAPAA